MEGFVFYTQWCIKGNTACHKFSISFSMFCIWYCQLVLLWIQWVSLYNELHPSTRDRMKRSYRSSLLPTSITSLYTFFIMASDTLPIFTILVELPFLQVTAFLQWCNSVPTSSEVTIHDEYKAVKDLHKKFTELQAQCRVCPHSLKMQ